MCKLDECEYRSDCEPNYKENSCCPSYDHCSSNSDSIFVNTIEILSKDKKGLLSTELYQTESIITSESSDIILSKDNHSDSLTIDERIEALNQSKFITNPTSELTMTSFMKTEPSESVILAYIKSFYTKIVQKMYTFFSFFSFY